MSTLAFSSAGSKLYISAGVPATIDAAGFGALTYTQIKDVTEVGPIGSTMALITHTPLDDPQTYKFKGISNAGALAVKGARVTSDAGQILLIAAAAARTTYAFKLLLADNTILYVQGQVMGYQTVVASAGVLTTFDSNIELSGSIITV